jgi:hypothetical protein
MSTREQRRIAAGVKGLPLLSGLLALAPDNAARPDS